MVKTYEKFKTLKPGKIRPEGWLREQLLRNRDGLGGHLDELEPHMIKTPYTTRETEKAWDPKHWAGWGAEIAGNYWAGEIKLAFALNDEFLLKKAEDWVNAVLKIQREDGYLGTYTENDDFFEDYNAWGTACGMNALIVYYEATGREDVLTAVHRCMLWFCDNWVGDKKTRYAGVHIVHPMMAVYRYTGDKRLLDFANDYYDFLERNDLFGSSLGAYLSPRLEYGAQHGGGYCFMMSHPAEIYGAGGEQKYLDASVNAYRKLVDKCMQKTGGATCDCEYLSPLGMVVETEYCALTAYNRSMSDMVRVTGDAIYSDEMERTTYNAAEGARKKDEKAIAYFTTPNQIYATRISSQTARHPHQAYAPCHQTSCCPVMSVNQMPDFLNCAAFRGADDGEPYLCNYTPCSIDFDDFKLKTETMYPFRDTIEFTVSADKKFKTTFHFRIPGWCRGAKIYKNGKAVDVKAEAGTYACVTDEFADGDKIKLVFPMELKVDYLNDKDRSRLFPKCFEYGPLLFSLQIEENWKPWAGDPVTPLPEGWYWYDVVPVVKTCNLDTYDEKGMRRWLLDYNVAVDENIKESDVSVEMVDIGDAYPWEKAPIKLHLTAYKAPWSYATYPYRSMEPYTEDGYSIVTDKRDITLVPYGCTNLRITYFPRAKIEK